MREELFWDRDIGLLTPEIEIERAINFGGFDYIREVREKHGLEKFKQVLLNSRNLSRKAVNYWCMVLKIDRSTARVFQVNHIWTPFR